MAIWGWSSSMNRTGDGDRVPDEQSTTNGQHRPWPCFGDVMRHGTLWCCATRELPHLAQSGSNRTSTLQLHSLTSRGATRWNTYGAVASIDWTFYVWAAEIDRIDSLRECVKSRDVLHIGCFNSKQSVLLTWRMTRRVVVSSRPFLMLLPSAALFTDLVGKMLLVAGWQKYS